MGDAHTDVDLHARLDGIQAETARAHAELTTHEATLSMLDARLTACETTDETLAVALAQRLDTLTGRVSELESTHATRGVWVRQELDALTASVAVALAQRLDTLTGRVSELESTHATRGVWVRQELDALTASVGVLRADLVSLQAQRDPWPVMLARLESLSDERNAARRNLMHVAYERDNAVRNCQTADAETGQMRAERNQLQQEAALYRALLTRVRSGDLVRCLTCEGQGHCADCEDERGAPLYGVPGLVPPEANAPLVADVDLTPEETKP